MGKLISDAVGANEGFDSETVSVNGAAIRFVPSTAVTDTEFELLFASE